MLEWKENSLIVNYCKNFCRANKWRLPNLCYDYDDLMQECWIVYNKCSKKYKDYDDKGFMAVFKESLINMINELSRKDKREKVLHADVDKFAYDPYTNDSDSYYTTEPTVAQIAEFNITLSEAPALIKKIVEYLESNESSGGKGVNTTKRKREIAKDLGLSQRVDAKKVLMEFLQSN